VADFTSRLLREAQRRGWDAFSGGSSHWQLTPPGGLSEETPRPIVVGKSASDHRAHKNVLAHLRRYGQHGPVLAEALDPRSNGAPRARTNGGPTHIPGDPQPERPTDRFRDTLLLLGLLERARVERHPTQTDVTIKFWAFNDDPFLKELLDLMPEGQT
jgi:hypothetical protein